MEAHPTGPGIAPLPPKAAAQIVYAAALHLLALIAGDLIFWNVGTIGLVVLVAMLLPANLLLAGGIRKFVSVMPDGPSMKLLRMSVLPGILNLDAIVAYLILPAPMPYWLFWMMALTAFPVIFGSAAMLDALRHVARRADAPVLEAALHLLKAAIIPCYAVFICVVVANAWMCNALNSHHPSSEGVYVGAFANADLIATISGVGTFCCGLTFCVLLERCAKATAPPGPSRPAANSFDQTIAGYWERRLPLLKTLAIIFVAFAVIYPFSPAAVQSRNMAKARAHIPKVEAALRGDPRFSDVELSSFTAHSGSLLISGEVPTQKDKDDLKKLVTATSPPIYVVFAVVAANQIKQAETTEASPTNTRP